MAVEMPDTETRLQVGEVGPNLLDGLVPRLSRRMDTAWCSLAELRCPSAEMRLTATRKFSDSAFCQFSDAMMEYT